VPIPLNVFVFLSLFSSVLGQRCLLLLNSETGSKKFTLFPSYEMDKLHVYPRVHPLWHKSQVNFDCPDAETHKDYNSALAFEAHLQPGDLLYVPPFWWHRVEALTHSVSLSTWSHTNVYEAMWAVYGYHLKLDTIENPTGKLYALRLYIDLLLKKLVGFQSSESFIHRMVQTRFAPLVREFSSSADLHSMCSGRIPTAAHVIGDCELDVKIVGDHFLTIGEETRDVLVMNYLEEISSVVIGAERTLAFFKYCFDGQEYMIENSQELDLWN